MKIGSLARKKTGNHPFLRHDITETNAYGVPCGAYSRSLYEDEIVVIIEKRVLCYSSYYVLDCNDKTTSTETWMRVIASNTIGWCPEKYLDVL